MYKGGGEMTVGDKLKIHAYKHDGKIYRTWDNAILIEINDDYIVLGNNKAKVTEEDGRTWYTKEPAIIYFYNNRWFNIIGQLKKQGIYYYCNIATPYIIDGDTIKYIDYDLDLRVFPNSVYKVLDKSEYECHKKELNYSNDIDRVVKYELDNLINSVKNKAFPFQNTTIDNHYVKYIKEIEKNG